MDRRRSLPSGIENVGRDIILGVVLPQAAERVLGRTEQVVDSILKGCRGIVTYGAPCTIARKREEALADLFSGNHCSPKNLPHDERHQLLKRVSERLHLDGKWSERADRDLISDLAEILGIKNLQ